MQQFVLLFPTDNAIIVSPNEQGWRSNASQFVGVVIAKKLEERITPNPAGHLRDFGDQRVELRSTDPLRRGIHNE